MTCKHLRLPLVLLLSLLAATLARAQAGPNNVQPTAADSSPSVADPLVRVLMAKGLLTTEEGRAVSTAATPAEQRDRLASLLLVVPAFGNLPANVADQIGFGERQGPDSQRPGIEGRFVTQWQLDRAAGVVPAQFIVQLRASDATCDCDGGERPRRVPRGLPERRRS